MPQGCIMGPQKIQTQNSHRVQYKQEIHSDEQDKSVWPPRSLDSYQEVMLNGLLSDNNQQQTNCTGCSLQRIHLHQVHLSNPSCAYSSFHFLLHSFGMQSLSRLLRYSVLLRCVATLKKSRIFPLSTSFCHSRGSNFVLNPTCLAMCCSPAFVHQHEFINLLW